MLKCKFIDGNCNSLPTVYPVTGQKDASDEDDNGGGHILRIIQLTCLRKGMLKAQSIKKKATFFSGV